MEIWEWTSQQLTCNLNLENSFWICGSGCSACKLNLRKSKLLYGDLGKDFSTVNLQAEFRKFLFGYLEVVVAPAN